MDELQLKNYWNNKRPKNIVGYTGRAILKKNAEGPGAVLKEYVQIDVKTMMTSNDAFLQKVIEKYNLKKDTNDATMHAIQQWVVQSISYLGDEINNYTMEYWQFPFETLTDKTGDCEDGALLIASLAINAGIPSFRVRVVAGMVQPAPTAPEGGHGYVSYLRESDNQWVIIDWCYLQDSAVPIDKKVLQKENSFYKEVWFSFNNEYSWTDKSFEFVSF